MTFDDREGRDVGGEWAVRVSVALIFTLVGLDKVASTSGPSWVPIFDAIGVGQWFRYFTCCVEVVGGLLFLIPPATMVGGFLLVATMLGAMATHIVILHRPVNIVFPAVFLGGVLMALAKLRRQR